jgi:hypothetical protein
MRGDTEKIKKTFPLILNKYKSGALFSIKVLLFIEKYLYYHKDDGSASIFGMMREERSLKFKDTEKIKKTFPLNLYRQIQGLFCVVFRRCIARTLV